MIKIYEFNDIKYISGRDVFKLTKNKSRFCDWIKNRIEKYNLIKDTDYILNIIQLKVSERHDYYITLNQAYNILLRENHSVDVDILNYIKDILEHNITINYTPLRMEYKFKDLLYIYFKDICEIKCQHCISGYRLDFYIPKYKIIIEYDEPGHNYRIQEDKERQKHILIHLENHKFIRVKQGEELAGINQILKAILV